jgi:hypothetical protein
MKLNVGISEHKKKLTKIGDSIKVILKYFDNHVRKSKKSKQRK